MTDLQTMLHALDEQQHTYSVLDRYYTGTQPLAFLSPEALDALGTRFSRMASNIPRLAVTSLAERLRITGLHRDMSPDRASTELAEDDEKRGIRKYNPLAYWTDQDIWRAINVKDLPYNPLHDQGYESIGCAPCTNPGAGREGRWAGTDKTECGLHVA